jgi:DUF4097 and DUF4098 domain-containing protein YvlB
MIRSKPAGASRGRIIFASTAVAALLLLSSASASLGAQEREDKKAFSWSGKLPADSWIRVKNLNGDVHVTPTTGDAVEVSAEKRWDRGDPRDVRFEILRDGENVTICALWDNDRQTSSCTADSYRANNNSSRRNDVRVYFTVKVPKGVNVNPETVNGEVDVAGVSSQVRASNVNGDVRVTTERGVVSAGSVNGSVDVEMSDVSGSEEMKFSSVNGDVTLRVPASFDAELSMSTVNGSVRSDFPITLEGRIDPRRMRGTIGKGGRLVKVSTVNGSLIIRKR